MKNLAEINVELLTENELVKIDGGSEFSEAVFRAIGWTAGQVVNAFNAMADVYGELHASGTPYSSALGRAI